MTVAVISDSGAALPENLRQELRVSIVPLHLTVDGKELPEDSLSAVMLKQAQSISTAAPGPGAFAAALGERKNSAGTVILTMAATVSSCHQSACVAAEGHENVRVIDTTSAGGGQALVVLSAARAAATGGDLEAVAAAASRAAARVNFAGLLGSLEHLVRTGRIPAAAGRTSDQLGIRPMFAIRNGQIQRWLPARSVTAGHRRLRSALQKSSPGAGAALHLAVMHSHAPQAAEDLMTAVANEVTLASSFLGSFGGALTAGAGLGVTGLAWWWEEA